MKYIFCIILLLFGNFLYSQGGCVGGNVTTLSPTINYGNSTTLTLNVPAGSFQWQYSSNNSDWSNVTSGTVSNTNNYPPINFSYTGALQTFVVPAGVTSINVEGVGAAGGLGSSVNNGAGGKGGRLIANLNTTPGETLYIQIGGKGKSGSRYNSTGQGGYNGGGNSPTAGGGGGGGATDIRRGSDDLSNRIFVVGGGGGGGEQGANSTVPGGDGGNGGGETGGNGSNAPIGAGRLGYGGTQISGGAAGIPSGFTDDATPGQLGIGGNGGRYWGINAKKVGGGGGGGYYGGGGGTNGKDGGGGGGGGGSSYSITETITTNTQGDASATGDGSIVLSYENEIPYSITSNYTTSPTSPTYYRAVVTDGVCVAYSTSSLISVINLDLIITNPLATLSSCLGTASSPTTFGVTGAGLTASITISAPSNFEVSTSSGGTYSSSLTLTNTSTVSQTLYVRLSSSASVGSKIGTITATTTGASATTSVSGTVNALPSISISETDVSGVSNNDAIICNGASATLTASGTTSFLWSSGAATTSSITITPSSSTTYTVTGTTSGCSNTASKTITVNSLPNIGISGTTTNPELVSLTASGGTTYAWSDGSAPSSATNTFDASGSYALSVTDLNGCISSTQLNITLQQWGLSRNGEKTLDSARQINANGQIASIIPLSSDGKIREYKPRIIRDGLVLNLDAGNASSYPGTGTTWYDLSGNSNNIVFSATPNYNSSNGGFFQSFNGSNTVSSTLATTFNHSSFTIEWWINPSNSSCCNNQITLNGTNWTDFGVHLYSNNQIYIGSNTSERFLTNSNTVSIGSWQCYTYTFENGASSATAKFYKNGVLLNSATNWSNNNNIISSIQLGLGGGNSINGSLGPIKIYNNALNPNQVQRNYNALKSRFGL